MISTNGRQDPARLPGSGVSASDPADRGRRRASGRPAASRRAARGPAAARARSRSPAGRRPRPRPVSPRRRWSSPWRYQRLAGGGAVLRSQAALAGPARLVERLGPRTAQLHDLGTMDEAAAGERDQVRLALAPARERGGPLLRAAHVVGRLAGEDHAAVDDPRARSARARPRSPRPWPRPAARRPCRDRARARSGCAPLVRGEGEQVGVAEALADRRRLAGGRGRRVPVAARLLLEDDRAGAGSHARRGRASADRSSSRWARPSQPPAWPSSPLRRQRHADPEGAPQRPQVAARVEVGAMGALEQLAGTRPRARACTRTSRAARGRLRPAVPGGRQRSASRRHVASPPRRRRRAPARARPRPSPETMIV